MVNCQLQPLLDLGNVIQHVCVKVTAKAIGLTLELKLTHNFLIWTLEASKRTIMFAFLEAGSQKNVIHVPRLMGGKGGGPKSRWRIPYKKSPIT
jgi:hypothetical protein